jgi:hypothetical protein
VIHKTGGTKPRLVDVEATRSLLLLNIIAHWNLIDERHRVAGQVKHLIGQAGHHSELVSTLQRGS